MKFYALEDIHEPLHCIYYEIQTEKRETLPYFETWHEREDGSADKNAARRELSKFLSEQCKKLNIDYEGVIVNKW